MKRILAVLLAIALSIGLAPSLASAQGGTLDDTPFEVRYPHAIDIWKTIERTENDMIAKQGASFVDAARAAYAIVEASETTEPGSLERHGEAFFWHTVDGAACGYNPGFRERVLKTATGAEFESRTGESVVSVKGSVGNP